MKNGIAIFGGIGIGSLMGLLIGMSASSVVGIVIGGITSTLIVLLGLKDKLESEQNALRIGAFGLSCCLTIILGVYLRVNNSFAPNVQEDIKKWTNDSIYSIAEAKKIVLFERLGFIPEGVQIDTAKRTNVTLLYSTEVKIDDCTELKQYEKFSTEEELNAYKIRGGIWKSIADSVSVNVRSDDQKKILHILKNCLCHD